MQEMQENEITLHYIIIQVAAKLVISPVIKFNLTVFYLKLQCDYIYLQILKEMYTRINNIYRKQK